MRNDRFSYVLRTIAGAYLIYLSYNILSSVAKGETGNHTIPVTIAAVIFIILGAVLVVFGVRGMIRMQKEGEQEIEEDGAETEVIEEAEETEEAEEVNAETAESDLQEDRPEEEKETE